MVSDEDWPILTSETAAEGGVLRVRSGLVVGSLITHLQGNHGVGRLYLGQLKLPTPPLGEAQTYRVSFPAALTPLICPVERFQVGAD